VCRIVRGDEVRPRGANEPEFAPIGTVARFENWDMPEQGILHVSAIGGTRFEVRSHATQADGLIVADVASLAVEPRVALDAKFQPPRASCSSSSPPASIRGNSGGTARSTMRHGSVTAWPSSCRCRRRSSRPCSRSTTPKCGFPCCRLS
jgi:hypothetical protein